MKSYILDDEELHKKFKLLSVKLDKSLTELLKEALQDILVKYERTREDSMSNL